MGLRLSEYRIDVKSDRRNFYNKMTHLEVLTQLDETIPCLREKIKFNTRKYDEQEQKGFRLNL